MTQDEDRVKTERRLRTVEIAEGAPSKGRLWAFGYPDLAAFLGMSEDAVRQSVSRNQLDPARLESIYAFKVLREVQDPPRGHRTNLTEARRKRLERLAKRD